MKNVITAVMVAAVMAISMVTSVWGSGDAYRTAWRATTEGLEAIG